MELVYFTLVSVALYFLADWILLRIEARLGHRFEQRAVVFMFLLLAMAMTSFWVIRKILE